MNVAGGSNNKSDSIELMTDSAWLDVSFPLLQTHLLTEWHLELCESARGDLINYFYSNRMLDAAAPHTTNREAVCSGTTSSTISDVDRRIKLIIFE